MDMESFEEHRLIKVNTLVGCLTLCLGCFLGEVSEGGCGGELDVLSRSSDRC